MKQLTNTELSARINRFMDRKLARLNGPMKTNARLSKGTARKNSEVSMDYIAL